MSIRIAICDDMKEHAAHLEKLICKSMGSKCDMDVFFDPMNLIKYLQMDEGYDVLFLDIGMEPIDGLEAAKRIRVFDKNLLIIFTTSMDDFMQQGYEVRAFRYLLKPVKEDALRKTLEAALTELGQAGQGEYLVNIGKRVEKILLDDIIYFESKERKITARSMNDAILFYKRIKDVAEDVKNQGFVQCHKSFIVNLRKIRRIDGYTVVLSNDEVLPISRQYSADTRKSFFQYIGGGL